MNLYFRFIMILLKALFIKKQPVLAKSRLNFRVLPLDCDINFHLNNSRYLSFMDLGRMYLLAQSKLLTDLYKKNWIPVITGVEVSFLKPLKPLQKFILVSQILGWDENYIYIEQRFESNGKLFAIALVKATIVINGKKCQMQRLIHQIDPNLSSPVLPQSIEHWQLLIAAKKTSSG